MRRILAGIVLVAGFVSGCAGSEPDAVVRATCGVREYDGDRYVFRRTAEMVLDVRADQLDAYRAILGTAQYGEHRICTFDVEYARD
jgi:hypothetical protein